MKKLMKLFAKLFGRLARETFAWAIVVVALSATALCQGPVPSAPSVLLTWTASVTPGTLTYSCYRGTSAGGENYLSPVNTSPLVVDTFTDTTVTGGNTYFYTCESDLSGLFSGPSNEVSVAVPVTPAPPTGLSGKAQ